MYLFHNDNLIIKYSTNSSDFKSGLKFPSSSSIDKKFNLQVTLDESVFKQITNNIVVQIW